MADTNGTRYDGLEGRVLDAAGLLAHEAGMEEHLRAGEAPLLIVMMLLSGGS